MLKSPCWLTIDRSPKGCSCTERLGTRAAEAVGSGSVKDHGSNYGGSVAQICVCVESSRPFDATCAASPVTRKQRPAQLLPRPLVKISRYQPREELLTRQDVAARGITVLLCFYLWVCAALRSDRSIQPHAMNSPSNIVSAHEAD